jgi:hypothetical protein
MTYLNCHLIKSGFKNINDKLLSAILYIYIQYVYRYVCARRHNLSRIK